VDKIKPILKRNTGRTRRILSTLAMLRVTAMRSHALCAALLAAAVLGGVDAAKKSEKKGKGMSVRAFSGSRPGEDKVEVRADAGEGERVLVCRPTSLGKRLAAPHLPLRMLSVAKRRRCRSPIW